MSMKTDDMIGRLVTDLRPIRPLRQRAGMARTLLAFAASVSIVIYAIGVRADILAGRPDPMFLTSSGLFLVLALASTWAAIDMARPSVGTRRDGWGWTAMMAAVLPVAALGLITLDLFTGQPVTTAPGGYGCLIVGVAAGSLTLISLVTWLRRGAPTHPALAGTLVGVAAGSAGIFGVSLCCPHNDLIHIGIWHGGTVVLMGVLGRLLLPRALAW